MEESPSPNKHITFTADKKGNYPLAYSIKKIAPNSLQLMYPNDDGYLLVHIVGTTKEGITLAHIEVPNENPLQNPVFGILGQSEGKLCLVLLSPAFNQANSQEKNIKCLDLLVTEENQVTPINENKIPTDQDDKMPIPHSAKTKIIYCMAAIPIAALALFGGYKATQDILHWSKEQPKNKS
jgi:hypothetical protein